MTHQPHPLPLKVSQKAREAAARHYPEHLWKQSARDDLAQAFAQFERDLTAPSGDGDVEAHIAKLREMAEDMLYDIVPSVRAVMICAADLLASTATKLAEVERNLDRAINGIDHHNKRAEAAESRLAQAVAALEVGKQFLAKCNSAWAAGEPSHRVRDMLDHADKFTSALHALKGTPDAQ